LRQRKIDIPDLIGELICNINAQLGTAIDGASPEAIKALIGYDFQDNNVRELRNMLEYAVVLEKSTQLTLESLPAHIRAPGRGAAAVPRGAGLPVTPSGCTKTAARMLPTSGAADADTPVDAADPLDRALDAALRCYGLTYELRLRRLIRGGHGEILTAEQKEWLRKTFVALKKNLEALSERSEGEEVTEQNRKGNMLGSAAMAAACEMSSHSSWDNFARRMRDKEIPLFVQPGSSRNHAGERDIAAARAFCQALSVP